MLKQEFEYFLENQIDLVEKYNGKIIVLKDKNVIGVYENESIALFETKKHHILGTFLIQKCTNKKSDYTAKFNSRVYY